jgi:hypothetical protein
MLGTASLWSIIVFQLTALKYIWSIENISTQVNLIMLSLLMPLAIYSLVNLKFSLKVWKFYLIPGILVLFFQNVNIIRNIFSNIQIYKYFGLTLPWIVFLVIPVFMKKGFIKSKKLWKQYYYFILIANIFSLIEYFLVFIGKYKLRMLEIPNGTFLSGKFTLFHMLEDGTSHERYYSCFMEPGDLAMYMLPAIAYAFYYKKYISLFIFVTALFFTKSLGGLIGLTLMVIILPLFFQSSKIKIYNIYEKNRNEGSLANI